MGKLTRMMEWHEEMDGFLLFSPSLIRIEQLNLPFQSQKLIICRKHNQRHLYVEARNKFSK